MVVKVIGPRDKKKLPDDSVLVYTVSRASGWSRGLSPFFCGPVELYNGYVAKSVENAWQFSKVYKEHLNSNGDPNEEYFNWG